MTFPDLKAPKVLEAISKFGSLPIKSDDAFFNSLPEQGPFLYEDGSIYLGNMKDNKRHGRGKYILADGSFYEGYWKVFNYFYLFILF